jgi:hypothetical protein
VSRFDIDFSDKMSDFILCSLFSTSLAGKPMLLPYSIGAASVLITRLFAPGAAVVVSLLGPGQFCCPSVTSAGSRSNGRMILCSRKFRMPMTSAERSRKHRAKIWRKRAVLDKAKQLIEEHAWETLDKNIAEALNEKS